MVLDKCQLFKDRVSICGPEIDRYGLHKTQKKIEPVVNALQPTNVSELRSLLGIVSNMHFSYQTYPPNFIHCTDYLRMTPSDIAQKTMTMFQNGEEAHYIEWCYLLIMIQNFPLCLATDASTYGEGFEPYHA